MTTRDDRLHVKELARDWIDSKKRNIDVVLIVATSSVSLLDGPLFSPGIFHASAVEESLKRACNLNQDLTSSLFRNHAPAISPPATLKHFCHKSMHEVSN